MHFETYDQLVEYINSTDEKVLKKYILSKEDIEIDYGYLIFDVEHRDKNKTLNAIAYSNNLGQDYHESCKWLVRNTEYYPGTMNLYLKMIIKIKRLNLCMVFTHNEDYVILFDHIVNKEDDVVMCKCLKYRHDDTALRLLYFGLANFYDIEKLMDEFREKCRNVDEILTKTTTVL